MKFLLWEIKLLLKIVNRPDKIEKPVLCLKHAQKAYQIDKELTHELALRLKAMRPKTKAKVV